MNVDMLFGNPIAGASWETLMIENILGNTEDFDASFFRTSNGTEIDLILERGNKKYAIECKLSSAPKLNAGFFHTIDELKIRKAWIAAPVVGPYPVKENVTVTPVSYIIEEFKNS